MNLYYFIAQRIGKTKKQSFSAIVTRIAIASITIGLAVILGAYGILLGFRQSVQAKVFSFSGHFQVSQRSLNNSYQETPVSLNTDLYKNYRQIAGVSHLQAVAHKAGILKTDNEVLGVVLKGIDNQYDKTKFRENIIAGDFIQFPAQENSLEIIISQKIADKLHLKVKDSVVMFFIQNPPRFRKLMIKGIYQTGMEDFDDKFILGDLRLVQRLNNWADTLAGSYEGFVKDFSRLDTIVVNEVLDHINYDQQIETVTQKHLDIFDWLNLLNQNVSIFLTLILTVASFNMISILLIMIMERVQMIGILKALGASNWQIRQIFIYKGIILIARGMLGGNLLGLGFCALQYYFRLIPLDAHNYYVSYVPIEWDWQIILAMNLLTFFIISTILLLPTMIIARVKPIKAIRFD
ncbi:MAG: FtsX-like permease family protein [Microscillaceae bacterium]|jgi:lipoprotein-releasing system permease protein|nr:FtsX-like permease family protein [Microscillaceae bacterium]